MSRTYNQEPRYVAILRHGTPVHDHSRGECDLEEYRAYLRAHGENKGPRLHPGEHKGCAKVLNIYYVNCWHAPSRGPYIEGFSHVEDETTPGGFTTVRYVKDRPVEPSYKPSLRHFLRHDGDDWVRAHVTDEPLAFLGEVPPCTTGYDRYNSSALNWSGPGSISLHHYGFTVTEETEMGDFLHCYYLKVVDMDTPCACDAPRPGWRFSCSLELSPMMEYGSYKPRYCTCLYCVGEPISEKRSRRRAAKASLDKMRHGVNSGYDAEDWDML